MTPVPARMAMAGVGILGLLLGFPVASALEPIQDHRDEWGVAVSLGVAYDTLAIPDRSGDYQPGFRPELELGLTRAITDLGDELALRVRLTDDSQVGPLVLLGYRGYFGDEAFKTFFQGDLLVSLGGPWGAGVHGGFGAQFDFDRFWGLFLQLGGGVTFGSAIFTSFDLQLGGQLRF